MQVYTIKGAEHTVLHRHLRRAVYDNPAFLCRYDPIAVPKRFAHWARRKSEIRWSLLPAKRKSGNFSDDVGQMA